MKHTWLLLIASTIVTLGAVQRAPADSDPDHVKTSTTGMITFIASTGLSTPTQGANTTNPVTITADADHFVAVSAYGGGGTTVYIDYNMSLTANGTPVGNAMGQLNKGAALDSTGYWEQAWSTGTRSATFPVGAGNVAGSESWIGPSNNPGARASATHFHTITVN